MNVLVTGGAGFIGSHFVRAMLAGRLPGLEDARVTVLDKLAHAGNFANLGAVAHDKWLDFVPGDVADAALAEVVVRRHDAIVHFAAEHDVTANVEHDVTSNILDDDKIRQNLGWHPRVEFASGLNSTVRWYRDNPDAWRPLLQ
ncbi:GDP-mannose 4,6-dehydratase [Paractinoplanes hotanensis]|uniref:GDP-mannose 4,6-dehydratase n=1 Tax=Paractinoplanes hotanensis TaxID=2906497 RepID=A0ABT0XWI5_9ACTN|nr:GDP-mannose 4,6-dehydratase [Actinoplanes hotanensis]MCM4077598.1 GDP-mannose 4,6-dehydratase [Actinoplanes hotanensis]